MKKTKNIIEEFRNMSLSPKIIGRKDNEEWIVYDADEIDFDNLDDFHDEVNEITLEPSEFQVFDQGSINLVKEFLKQTKLSEEKLNQLNTCIAAQLFSFVEKLWGYASFPFW